MSSSINFPTINLVQMSDEELAALRALPELIRQLAARSKDKLETRLESPREVAKRLRINIAKVRDAIKRGELPAARRPGRGGHIACWIKPADADRVLGYATSRID
jgi:hypothetical protein